MTDRWVEQPDALKNVLLAAAIAPGNQARFLQAGLIDSFGSLASDWRAAFQRLQPLQKAEVRRHPGRFLAGANDVVYRGQTSGTSGDLAGSASDAFTYFAGDRWNQKRLAARQQSLAWWGFDPKTPMLNVASRLGPVRSQDSTLVGKIDADFLALLLRLIADGPVILRGYPSRLCEVAVALRRSGLAVRVGAVVGAIATGERLFESQRVLLKETFGAPVINEYGCQESGISGLSCPEAQRLHLDGDRCLYEIVEGRLLTTDLYNTTLPLVRYSSGDVLDIKTDNCPCGRLGLTAKVLGRAEDLMLLSDGLAPKKYWTKESDLPAFDGILNYRIQLQMPRHRLWVQPESTVGKVSLIAIKQWFEETFGQDNTDILIESFTTEDSGVSVRSIGSESWVNRVTKQAWSSWLGQPLPLGEAEAIASLLEQLVAPRHIVLQGLSPEGLRQANMLAKSEPSRNVRIEVMKIRVLLWATGLIAEADSNSPELTGFYDNVLNKFQQLTQSWQEFAKKETVQQFSALGFDLLAPLLTMNASAAKAQWPAVCSMIQRWWPEGCKADAFTIHHYLAVLDVAGQNAQRSGHPWVPALRPLSAILLGDFYRAAAALRVDMVAAWAEMIHDCPGEFSPKVALKSSEVTDFHNHWKVLRWALLTKDKTQVSQQLALLFKAAQTPEQIAHCWLEKGYATLLFNETLNPTIWLKVLRAQVGILGGVSRHSQVPDSRVNPMPWVPILSAIAPELMKVKQPELAYACLFAAAPPNRKLSNFDRQSVGVNGKQAVISGEKLVEKRVEKLVVKSAGS